MSSRNVKQDKDRIKAKYGAGLQLLISSCKLGEENVNLP